LQRIESVHVFVCVQFQSNMFQQQILLFDADPNTRYPPLIMVHLI